jgi:superfamily II DNA or RNA helicase|tara:strand:- start:2600 stop:4066 length:1467 start_codon:yes stop_codon:yes gene_type:complete
MSSCKLVIKDEVNVKFENLDLKWRQKLHNKFKYQVPYAFHLPSVKLGRWDGKIAFFGLGGTTYLSLVEQILPILEDAGVYVDFEDKRQLHNFEFKAVDKDYLSHIKWPKNHPEAGNNIELRDYQVETINKFIENPQCIQEIATGAGKTIITAALCQLVEPYGRTITIVPNKSLVTQTEEDFLACNLDTGVYYGDRKEVGRYNTIATWQSLNVLEKKAKNEHSTEFKEFCDGINTVIIDEVHMAKADVLKRLLTGPFAHCGIRWGLTGTVPKAEYEFMGIKVSIGDVINKLPAKELQDKGVLANCHVNVLQTQDHPMFKNYQEELKWLTTDSNRMTWIAQTIKDISSSGNTLILVDRISAGEILQKKLKDSVFISGSTKNTERKEHYDEVSTAQSKIIIATYGVASVGINIPRIFNLVLIEPGKSFVRVIQSIGRGIRKAEDKDNVQIWDITSSCKFAKRHLTQRKKFYKEANYPYNIEKIDYENPYTR